MLTWRNNDKLWKSNCQISK